MTFLLSKAFESTENIKFLILFIVNYFLNLIKWLTHAPFVTLYIYYS